MSRCDASFGIRGGHGNRPELSDRGTGQQYPVSRIRPLVYRVVPGRIDLIRTGWFGAGDVAMDSISLRDVRIEIRYEIGEVKIGDDPDIAHKISLQEVSEPREFAVAIVRAAISTAQPPALPEGELLG
jgi:hypothetical protein